MLKSQKKFYYIFGIIVFIFFILLFSCRNKNIFEGFTDDDKFHFKLRYTGKLNDFNERAFLTVYSLKQNGQSDTFWSGRDPGKPLQIMNQDISEKNTFQDLDSQEIEKELVIARTGEKEFKGYLNGTLIHEGIQHAWNNATYKSHSFNQANLQSLNVDFIRGPYSPTSSSPVQILSVPQSYQQRSAPQSTLSVPEQTVTTEPTSTTEPTTPTQPVTVIVNNPSHAQTSSSSEQRENITLLGSNYDDVIIDHTSEVFKDWRRGGQGRNDPLLETKCKLQGGSASITREVCKDINNGVGRLHFETIKCNKREGDKYWGCITSDPCHIFELEGEPQYCKFDENNKIKRVNQDGSDYQFKINYSRTEGGGGISSDKRMNENGDMVPVEQTTIDRINRNYNEKGNVFEPLPDLTGYDVKNDVGDGWAGVATSNNKKPIHDNLANSFIDDDRFPGGSLKAPAHPVMTYSLEHMKNWIQQEPGCAGAEGAALATCAKNADWAIPANMVGINIK